MFNKLSFISIIFLNCFCIYNALFTYAYIYNIVEVLIEWILIIKNLNILNFLLLISFILLIFIKKNKIKDIKRLSIIFCINIIKFFILYYMKFSLLLQGFYFIFSFNWFGIFFNIEYFIGFDRLSFIFIFLTVFLIPICLIVSWKSIYYNTKYFFLLFLILEILLINVFCSLDLILFYISFESILIPMYFLIGYWGSRERRMHAAYQFFLFTLGGSLFMLLSLLFCQLNSGTTNYIELSLLSLSPYRELAIWLCFFIGFAVKIPLMPVHIWLPEAHVESATGGSVALAGILLKLGTFGMLRFLVPLFEFSTSFFTPMVYLISFFGVFYASLTTLRQIDMKKIIAYSSIIHMNYLMFGLFSGNIEGLVGSLILMVAHGFVSGGLFVCIGILYDRYHTRLQKSYGGLNYFMPLFSIYFLLFTLANISFPGSLNFIGEFLVLFGIFSKNIILGILVMFCMILSTCYSLWLYNKVFSGLLVSPNFKLSTKLSGPFFKTLNFKRLFLTNYTDINLREFLNLLYLLLPTIFLGLNPSVLIELIEIDLILNLNNI
jgi:proton-translocating NADH-quinone oxidoreductase chain M